MPDKYEIKPLNLPGLADYHCHPDYSVDARGSIDEFCLAAIKRGLAEICFTTHYDSNPRSEGDVNSIAVNGTHLPATPDNLEAYVEAVKRAHEKYYPGGLAVKLGIEIGWYPECEEMVDNLKKRFHFDYVLCGIHELNHICFCCTGCYEKCFRNFRNMNEMLETYFQEVIRAAQSNLFDTIAHLDYYKKYGEKYYGTGLRRAHQPFMVAVFEALKETRTALEINTAAIRKGLSDYYPSVEIINTARKAGVEIAHLGSDAHAPGEIGYDFEAASALLPPLLCESED
ncbi:MAG: histidinol-phosphatase [candidate division Zixibacteria bacterium]|nr:histidinol-phosphatase [candidate division Zixibacteria bacterium]MDD5427349.1 histidinol-phosphatase [candidate division Zixibacteria bacterium]